MKIHDALVYAFDNAPDVRMIKKAITFETPISDYEYKEIQFSVLFDEMSDETFVFVGKEYDYTVIEKLMHSLR